MRKFGFQDFKNYRYFCSCFISVHLLHFIHRCTSVIAELNEHFGHNQYFICLVLCSYRRRFVCNVCHKNLIPLTISCISPQETMIVIYHVYLKANNDALFSRLYRKQRSYPQQTLLAHENLNPCHRSHEKLNTSFLDNIICRFVTADKLFR